MRPLTLLPVLALLTTPAAAYVPNRSDSGAPLRWVDTDCVLLRLDARGSDDIPDDSDLQAATRAADNWVRATSHCAYLGFVFLPVAEDLSPAFGQEADGSNVITWIEEGWTSEYEFDPDAIAITVTAHIHAPGEESDGNIVDADIMLNGEGFTFVVVDESRPPDDIEGRFADIENTITHELGHLLGIGHPCYDPRHPPDPIPDDHLGNRIPPCTLATAEMKATTMYPSAPDGETRKRTLEADDVLAACETYPIAKAPGQCLDVGRRALGSRAGCACSAGSPDALLPLLLLCLGTLRRRS